MFYRKIIDNLKDWKDKKQRKPLILRGARQVGKTSAVLLFGQKYFSNTIHINLEKPEHGRLFRSQLSLNEFEKIINVHFGQPLVAGKTLLFIDEIQESPWLVNLLRFFREEKPGLHVLTAGSLFEVKLKEKSLSLPVGRVEFNWLYPLDFFEYLEARGEKNLLEFLKKVDLKEKIPPGLHQQALSLFYEYALIGGMPEAVKVFTETNDLNKVNSLYSNLLTSIGDDVYKYSSLAKSKYLTFVLEQTPSFAGLPVTYEKFGGSNYKSREMNEAFGVLSKAMILYQIRATKSSQLPLVPQRKKPPKLLFLDVGLVNFQMGIQPEYSHLKELADFYQGRISEQIVGQQLLASFIDTPAKIYYWYKKTGSQAEVDFCLNYQGQPLGIEVKSGVKGRLRSAWEFLKTTQAKTVIRVYSGQLKMEEVKFKEKAANFISLPFYLFLRWQEAAGL